MEINDFLSVRYDEKQSRAVPSMPRSWNLVGRMLWDAVLKTAVRSQDAEPLKSADIR